MISEKEYDKIVKVLNLATSSNPFEADAAFEKASQLLEEHDYSIGRLQIEKKYDFMPVLQGEPMFWLKIVSSSLEETFGIRFIFEIANFDWLLIGDEIDIKMAFYIFKTLYDHASESLCVLRKEYKIESMPYRSQMKFMQEFLEGFAIGWDETWTPKKEGRKWQDRLEAEITKGKQDAEERKEKTTKENKNSTPEPETEPIFHIGIEKGRILGQTI